MLRKGLIALVVSVALGAGVAPGIAAMHDGGSHDGGGFHSGFHDGGHGRFHGRLFRPGFRDHGGYDFYHQYGYSPYAYYAPYGSCWQPRRVMTPYGWRRIEVWVCG